MKINLLIGENSKEISSNIFISHNGTPFILNKFTDTEEYIIKSPLSAKAYMFLNL